ncbi:MAG: pirin family protein [Bryobacterales bacterium]|nr:pirin family protein [Bryobacterales bacterium]
MSKLKQVRGIHGPGSQHWVGDGFPVRNLFPSNGLADAVNPFLMFDYAGPTTFAPSDQPRGVEEHPHRGFETVTIAYQGSVDHRDSSGNAGSIGPGDVQWMTAASGVVHEEKHGKAFTEAGGTFEMVQLWVNLPAAHKMSPPRYQGIVSADIPVVSLADGATARVIAGTLQGAQGPARTVTPVGLFDLRLKAGSKGRIEIPQGHNASIALLQGDVLLNGASALKGEAKIATLSREGDAVEFEALADSTLLLMSGEPINEPVASYGPFVMNTQEEIRQAIADYRSGRMGHLNG